MRYATRIGLVGAALAAFASTASAAAADSPRALREARAPLGQLERVETVRSLGVRFSRYRQELGGVPLLGAEAVVTDAPGRSGDLLADSTRRLRAPDAAGVARLRALAVARGEVDVGRGRGRPAASLVAVARDGGSRLAWRVVLPSLRPLATWEVLVDARSASVLRVRDLLRRATGPGRVFDMNPIEANGGSSGLPSGGSDADDPDFDYRPVTLERLQLLNCLSGDFVRARVGPPGSAVDACEPGWNFGTKSRADSEFEAVMAYFHIDRAQAYVRSLGFNNVREGQQQVFANSFAADNSFFDPSNDRIELGAGGTDDGEDGDVIVHEYGHSIQDDQVPDFGSSFEAGSMGEGFGDYLAAAMANSFAPAPSFAPCVGEWDAFGFPGSPACIRRVDWSISRGQTGPDCTNLGDVHCLGEAWSSALWAIRGALGGANADRLVIQSHFSLTPTASFDDGALALLAADAALYGRAFRQSLISILGARGFVDPERLDDSPADAVPLSVPGRAGGQLSLSSDRHDVYRVSLTAGRPVEFRLSGSIADADLRLLAPGAGSVDAAAVAASEKMGSAETINFTPSSSGDHYLDVRAISGAGPYELIAETDDADGDGVADGRDNCPNAANRDQRDWDGDERGDRCDRSTRIAITRVRRRGRRITITGSLRPTHLAVRAFRLRVARRACRGRSCRFRARREPRARRSIRRGRATVRFRLPRGAYRVRAVLRAAGYRRSVSRAVRVRVPR